MTVLAIRSFAVTFLTVLFTTGAAWAQALPAGWSTRDIGAVGATGAAISRSGALVVTGSGADVWNGSDEFRFLYQQLTGDGSIVTEVTAIEDVDDWVKAGVMMRDTLSADSSYAFMLVSSGRGLAFQRRTRRAGSATHTDAGSGRNPAYVKLTRSGSTFTAYRSANGSDWKKVGSQSISMASTIYVGLAVTSHLDRVLASATFEHTSVTPADGAPADWSSKDIGSVGVAGEATWDEGTLTLKGAGADVWGASDAFRFAYTALDGDGTVVSRVATLEKVDAWVKAGVMMRESLSANSRHAFMLVSPGKGLAFQRRTSTGASSKHTDSGSGTAPYYVKLTRKGKTVTAYKSTNGSSWTKVASESISLPSRIYVGVAVSSHDTSQRATATFTATSVTSDAGEPEPEPKPEPRPEPQPKPEPEPEPEPEPDPGKDDGDTTTLRVLHWNLYHGQNAKKKWAFPRQMEVIAKADPDLISLNEVEKFNSSYGNIDQAAELAKYLTEKTGKKWYHYMRVGSGSSKGIGNAVLTRFPLVSTSYCQLSGARNAVHLGVVVNGRAVNVWSTHLSVESASYRVEETEDLLACMDNFSEQRLVAGDFNSQAGSREIDMMLDAHTDAWKQAKSLGSTKNYSGNCDGCTRNSRIDYVFTSKAATRLVLKSAQILDTRDSAGTMASDHKPMLIVYAVR